MREIFGVQGWHFISLHLPHHRLGTPSPHHGCLDWGQDCQEISLPAQLSSLGQLLLTFDIAIMTVEIWFVRFQRTDKLDLLRFSFFTQSARLIQLLAIYKFSLIIEEKQIENDVEIFHVKTAKIINFTWNISTSCILSIISKNLYLWFVRFRFVRCTDKNKFVRCTDKNKTKSRVNKVNMGGHIVEKFLIINFNNWISPKQSYRVVIVS